MDFVTLKKNLKKDFKGFTPRKVALLGDSATQFLAQATRAAGYNRKVDLQIFESDYDQIDLQIIDTASELYNFSPQYVVIFFCTQKLLEKFYKSSYSDRVSFADNFLTHLQKLTDRLSQELPSTRIDRPVS